MRVPLDRQVTVAFALALALLIALSAVSYRGIGMLVDAFGRGEQSRQAIEEAAFMSVSVIVVTGLAAVILLYLARLVIVRELRRRQRAERALQRINSDLEDMVAARTEDLTRVNDSLRQSEARVRESRAQLAEIIASAMDAIINVDEAEAIVLFNAAAERMFGCPAAQAVGQPVTRFIPGLSGRARLPQRTARSDDGRARRWLGVLGRSIGLGDRSRGQEALHHHSARHHRARTDRGRARAAPRSGTGSAPTGRGGQPPQGRVRRDDLA
jgi:PAS domain-containing protein